MRVRLISFAMSVMVAFAAMGIDIDSRAGHLSGLLTDLDVTELRLSGTVNAQDMEFIAGNLPLLKTLDLGKCRIEADSERLQTPANTIPAGMFAGSAIESVVFPTDGPIYIEAGAFASTKLKSVTIACGDIRIGTGAFADCKELTEINISGPAVVGDYAFRACRGLTAADLSGVTAIGDKAFGTCPSLTNVTFGSRLASIGFSAFEGCALAKANLAATKLTAVGDRAFARNTRLSETALPSSVGRLGKGAFADCTGLRSFILPSSCDRVPMALLKDSGVRELGLSDAVELGAYSLKGCSELQKVVLPPTLSHIADNAMEGMTALWVVNAADLRAVPELGENVWAGVEQSNVTLLTSGAMVEEFREAVQWQEFNILDEAESSLGASPEVATVRGRIAGGELQIESTGANITEVEIYNVAGVKTGGIKCDTPICRLSLQDMETGILIIRVTLADASKAILKLAR